MLIGAVRPGTKVPELTGNGRVDVKAVVPEPARGELGALLFGVDVGAIGGFAGGPVPTPDLGRVLFGAGSLQIGDRLLGLAGIGFAIFSGLRIFFIF